MEHAQDVVAITVGVVLIALAAVVLVSAIVDFIDGADGPISSAAPVLLDRVLLVLILVEIVYTVVLSLRAHRLVAQPLRTESLTQAKAPTAAERPRLEIGTWR